MTNLQKLDKAIVMALNPGRTWEEAERNEGYLKIKRSTITAKEQIDHLKSFGLRTDDLDENEKDYDGMKIINDVHIPYPNTIDRVMQALENNNEEKGTWNVANIIYKYCYIGALQEPYGKNDIEEKCIKWKLLKDNNTPCTTADQSEETIEALLKLFKTTSHRPPYSSDDRGLWSQTFNS